MVINKPKKYHINGKPSAEDWLRAVIEFCEIETLEHFIILNLFQRRIFVLNRNANLLFVDYRFCWLELDQFNLDTPAKRELIKRIYDEYRGTNVDTFVDHRTYNN